MSLESELDEVIKRHLENQPESITCANCGENLKRSCEVDAWHNQTISVEPCDCLNDRISGKHAELLQCIRGCDIDV